jgi:6-phosphogluconate dehydrogenase
MVHNGIEYGIMQAYAEGFEVMARADEFNLDLHEIASIWRYGSVVRSWLLDLAERALRPDADFEGIAPVAVDSGEGRWTALEAIHRGVPAPVISTSLFTRFASQDKDSFQLKMVAALRNQFGGHAVTLESGGQGMETETPTN